MRTLFRRWTGLLGFGIALLLASSAAAAPTVPEGFEDRQLTQVPYPTGMVVAPDERVLITTKNGPVYVYEDGILHSTPALDLTQRVCADGENGLSGVTVGPDFLDTGHVYLYYTYDRGADSCGTDPWDLEATPVNRVSRFVLGEDDRIDPASETVLIDNIPSPTGMHNGGDLRFGKDGYLYVTVGDGYCDYANPNGCGPFNRVARYRHALTGKVLRITSDGEIPANNPFTGPGTARCNLTGRATEGTWCREIYALGLRNPFKSAFDPNAAQTRFFINDVGHATWEEIDEGVRGADYGWNLREGYCATDSTTDCGPPPADLTNPIFAYGHSDGCSSVTGGAFVPHGVWPAEFERSYLYGDFVCGKLFRLKQDDSGAYGATEVASGLGGIVAMEFASGSDDALFYLTWDPPSLHSVTFTGDANRTPRAVAQASPTSGELPVEVNFDATGSDDPDGDSLLYEWDFGDGSPPETGATATHLYETADTYTARLEVTDPAGATDSQTIRIDAGNVAPVPTIDSPASAQLFSVGETITLSGSATDAEDGTLPDSALTWEVVKHHATHSHPFLPPTTGNGVEITAPIPEGFSSTTNTYLVVRLTATDSRGLTHTVTREVRPALVNLTFATQPGGLLLHLNDITAPASITSWEGWSFMLNAPDPQFDPAGQGQTFVSWSDGGAREHTITTPPSDTGYTATFTSRYVRPVSAGHAHFSLVPAYEGCVSPNAIHGPPLEVPSCSPPRQATPYTTVGTYDANEVPANSVGYADLMVAMGDPSTPANEADVRIKVSMSGVLDRTRSLDYYVGALQAQIPIQITDRQNGAGTTDSGTVAEFPLSVDMPCVLDFTVGGSTCHAATTMNALIPGSVVERARAMWELGTVQVFDGGEDSDPSTPGNGILATQGLFAP